MSSAGFPPADPTALPGALPLQNGANPYFQQAVVQQPQASQQQQPFCGPTGPGVPPQLGYLSQLDQLIVKQKKEALELLTGFEKENKYNIYNNMGQQIYAAKEDSSCCNRAWCDNIRPFTMDIVDSTGNPIIRLDRPLACDCCCCPCCLQTLEVQSPPGTLIGMVNQDWSLCTPRFTVYDEGKNPILKIKGPFCTTGCCSDVEFKVLSLDGNKEVGMITKQWTGFAAEAFTDADNFSVTFPMDLSVTAKATLLGALLLIDYTYYEFNNAVLV